jgi:regulatory protein
MKEIVVDEIKNRIYTRSVRKIARRPHSTREVLNYCDRVLYKNLDDWLNQSFVKISSNVQDEIKQDIIQELKARDLLSDKKFAQWWVNSRKKYKPRSTYMIKGELMQKGISNKVINSLDLGREANIQMAQSLFDKKFNPEIADKDSVIKYLKNKKFNWDIIKYILKRNNLE